MDATKLDVQLVPGYLKLDKKTRMMVPTYPTTWPANRDAPLAPIVNLAEALSEPFSADKPNGRWYRDGRCYIMQCAPRRLRAGATQGPRLAGKAWERGPVTMILLMTDVDAELKKTLDFDSARWWGDQQPAIADFVEAHPGAFVASSRGGLRIYQVLREPFVIDGDVKANEWKQRYVAWVQHVAKFPWVGAAHGGADQLVDWTRLQRIPHDTRDGVLQQLPTIGDPRDVGLVDLPSPAPDPRPRSALRPYTGATRTARVTRVVVQCVADVLPREGDGVHEAAFALGGLMSAAEWAVEDCVGFIVTAFEFAGIRREDIARTAELSVLNARAGQKTYGWRRFLELCSGDGEKACDMLRDNIPGLERDSLALDAMGRTIND